MSETELLTNELKKASRSIHDLSDALVNAKLIGLFADKELWGLAISNFYHVFKVLEQQLIINFSNPALEPFENTLSKLFRTSGFEKDLHYFLGEDWKNKVVVTPAVEEYIKHVKDLGMRKPVLLLAHAFTQFLAMAAGGQIIRRTARKQMNLPEHLGTSAFDFEQYDLKRVVAEFKQLLNDFGATMDPKLKEEFIAEHCRVFRFNNSIVGSFNIPFTKVVVGYVKLLPKLKIAAAAAAAVAAIVACRALTSRAA